MVQAKQEQTKKSLRKKSRGVEANPEKLLSQKPEKFPLVLHENTHSFDTIMTVLIQKAKNALMLL